MSISISSADITSLLQSNSPQQQLMFSQRDFLMEANIILIRPPTEAINPNIKLSETGSSLILWSRLRYFYSGPEYLCIIAHIIQSYEWSEVP